MVIYGDLILLVNFLSNFLMIVFIEKLFKETKIYWRGVICSLLSCILVFLSIYNQNIYKVFKISGGIITGLVGFKSYNNFQKLVKISSFYALNFSFVGFLISFRVNNHLLLFVALSLIFIIYAIENNKKYYIFSSYNKYNVMIKMADASFHIKGFLDTGNRGSYLGKPIVYVNEKYKPNSLNIPVVIDVETVNGCSQSLGYFPNLFIIEINKVRRAKKVLVVYTKMEEDCLLNPLLLL